METQTNFMIDIETLGTQPDCVIVAIGACEFNIETGEINDIFYQPIKWEDQPGRNIEPDTVKFWLRQSEEAKAELLNSGIDLEVALSRLRDFISFGETVIWANGTEFDISILSHAYFHCPLNKSLYNGKPPWDFWKIRDCRTLRAASKGIVDKREFPRGEAHNALDDAKYQAAYVSAMWQALRRGAK